MITVYLDQAKWIDLARAFHGRADGERFRGALDAARHAVRLGLVQFPLSMGHYVETWRTGNDDRRARLAQAMVALSQGRTMARPPDLCDSELDAFIAEFQRTPVPPPWPPLGWGFGHAAGYTRDLSREALDLEFELQHLAVRPEGFDGYGRGHLDFGDRYRDGERQLVGLDVPAGSNSKDMSEAILAGSAVMEIHENIASALKRANLPIEALGAIGLTRPGLPSDLRPDVLNGLLPVARAFIAQLPTRDAALRLRLRRHQDPNAKWETNDMIDIAYLACAVVHCDVVVTEKQWVHEMRGAGILDDLKTRAFSDFAELPAVLIDLAK